MIMVTFGTNSWLLTVKTFIRHTPVAGCAEAQPVVNALGMGLKSIEVMKFLLSLHRPSHVEIPIPNRSHYVPESGPR